MTTQVTVRIPTPLRGLTGGSDQQVLRGATVRDVLAELERANPGISERILTHAGNVQYFVNIFIDTQNIKDLSGLATQLTDGNVISIVPAIAGGSGQKARDMRLSELKARILQISPAEATALQQNGALLVDVRDPEEVSLGKPAGAFCVSRGFLELRIEDIAPDLERHILVLCAGGTRSLFAADDLRKLGYSNVSSVTGGFTRWVEEGHPLEQDAGLTQESRARYARHIRMPEIGENGQKQLLKSRVLLIGAGGLGSAASFYLAAAGVGMLGLVDNDKVERSNLQRQILHTDSRIGMLKVESARITLHNLNPTVDVRTHPVRLDSSNVDTIFAQYDLVVDGSDNFATRFLVNDACIKHRLPNVHGSVFRFEGQVAVFWPGNSLRPSPCYRCLYPAPPPPSLAPSCSEAGVLGVLPGIVGLLQSIEAIKILLRLGNPMIGRMLCYDALQTRFSEFITNPNPNCEYCASGSIFPGYANYQAACASPMQPDGERNNQIAELQALA